MELNDGQKYAIDLIKQGKSIFITGPAGSGKSTIISSLPGILPFKKITLTSTTGISALLIGGITIHSFSGIGIGDKEYDKIITNNYIKKQWFQTDILIIDEISMLSLEFFELISKVGSGILSCPKPFGGLQVIITGDFAQLPPVKDPLFCFESSVWKELITDTIYLKTVIRQSSKKFQKCLNEIRLGSISEKSFHLLESRRIQPRSKHGIIPTIIFPLKIDVESINQKNIKKLLDQGNEFRDYSSYITFNKLLSDSQKKIYTNLINKSCSAHDSLKIVKGMQVMIIANLDVFNGIANGTKGIVSDFIEDLPEVTLIDNRKIVFKNYKFEYYDKFNGIRVAKHQIPLIPAYAITIHKSQGCTLDSCIIDAGKNIFEHGQMYTALSRVKNINRLYLLDFDASKIYCNPKVKDYYCSLLP